MVDIFQDKIIFPLSFNTEYGIKLRSIYPNWRSLKSSVPIANSDNFGVLTGRRNNITVFQTRHVPITMLGFEDVETLKILTPDGYTSYIFQYEPKVHSIYKLNQRVSLFNGNAYIVAGHKYRLSANPILKMPKPILNYIIGEQSKYQSDVSESLYDFLMLLSNDWFNNHNSLQKIIFALKNSASESGYNESAWKATFRKVCADRSDYYHEDDIYLLFQTQMNATQRRIRLGALEYNIRKYNSKALHQWKCKWHMSGRRKLIFKEGAILCLKDAKAIFSTKQEYLKPERLCRINPSITIERKTVCKACMQLHKINCCKGYHRTNKSTRLFIMNAEVA
jgi:hypothetical protein